MEKTVVSNGKKVKLTGWSEILKKEIIRAFKKQASLIQLKLIYRFKILENNLLKTLQQSHKLIHNKDQEVMTLKKWKI